jgi:hypothetical protein
LVIVNLYKVIYLVATNIYLSVCLFIISIHILLVRSFFPSLVLAAGRSTATPEEIEAKREELEKQFTELEENREERKKVDEQNSLDGDMDSPNEQNSADELEAWDSLITDNLELITDLIN